MMTNHSLTAKELESIQFIIEKDISIWINENKAYFEELLKENDSIKDYVDEYVTLANKFDIDFWRTVRLNGNDFSIKRLEALYKGESLDEYYHNYEKPSEAEILKDLFKTLLDKKESKQ